MLENSIEIEMEISQASSKRITKIQERILNLFPSEDIFIEGENDQNGLDMSYDNVFLEYLKEYGKIGKRTSDDNVRHLWKISILFCNDNKKPYKFSLNPEKVRLIRLECLTDSEKYNNIFNNY